MKRFGGIVFFLRLQYVQQRTSENFGRRHSTFLKATFYVSNSTFWGEEFCWEVIKKSFSWKLSDDFRNLAKNVSGTVVKLALHVTEGKFGANKIIRFFKFLFTCFAFWSFKQKSQNFSGRTYGAFLKNGFYLYRGTVSGNKCLKKKQIINWTDFKEKVYGGFSKKYSEGLSCSKQSERNFFVTVLKLSINWFSFRPSSGKPQNFWGTMFHWVIHLSGETIQKLSR